MGGGGVRRAKPCQVSSGAAKLRISQQHSHLFSIIIYYLCCLLKD